MKKYLYNNLHLVTLSFFILCLFYIVTITVSPVFFESAFAIDNASSECQIDVTPKVIPGNATVTLSWSSPTGATTTRHWLYGIYPDRNGRAVTPTGSISFVATKTTPYTFRFLLDARTVSCAVRLTVDPSLATNNTNQATTTASTSIASSSTCFINVSPNPGFGLATTTVTWSSPSDSTNHKLYGIYPDRNGRSVALSGTIYTVATKTTAFTLTYKSNGANVSCGSRLDVPFFTSTTTSPNPKPEIVIGLFGQSFSEALFADPARSSFATAINQAGYPISIVFHGSGGSSALKENAPSGGDRYWWDLDAQRPGPQLIAAINTINNTPKKPTKIVWLQGEGDSVASANGERYYKATAQIIWALKKAINPTNPNSVESYMHVIGRRISSNPNLPGIQAIRDQQLLLIDKTSLEFLVDTWDLPLLGDDTVNHLGNSHMNAEGNALLGWRAAQTLLASVRAPANQAPYLSNITNVDGKKVRLNFITRVDGGHSTLTNPLRPSHIALRVGSTTYTSEQLEFSWINNKTLEITLPTATTSAITTTYPYGAITIIDRENIIKDGYGTPIRSFSVTRNRSQ